MGRVIAVAALLLCAGLIGSCGNGGGDDAIEAICGNGVIEAGESCDFGGRNVANRSLCDPGETCCMTTCTEQFEGGRRFRNSPGRCGNGFIEPRSSSCNPNEPGCFEECDDGSRNCESNAQMPGDENGPRAGGDCPQADSNPCCFNCVRPYFSGEDFWYCNRGG
jgi:hypothetical protein